ncbi:hypothetical protein [Streptomyces marianii]|uniref:Helicase C-terminal domain-containing protein n=1 Tax=Streptomyces marianii TaxID=1817406 RepID=A0A5R9DRB5_9ACTN|nr:hypothetical protein [Streptomyces marianii]TLQ38938.1 hypothetical protein FEF34_39645 [Streptomyces marianii]
MSSPVEIRVAAAPDPEPESRLGPIGRARASLAAIEVLLRLREDQAAPTKEDLAVLRRWPGWGPLAPALAPDREGTWAELGEQLQRLLSPREYRQAEQGTSTAYYTPDRIADACWSALQGLGFNGGRVLEPGCGAGTFINHTPAGLDVDWYGVERDPTTAGIAALLHPDAEIINARLQDAALQSNSVDAVLGNVPYGNFAVHDKTAPKAVTDSIHNYFIWRSVQALRPGGVAILLTSRYTMDSQDEDARRAIAKHADLLGAIRLPNGALAEGGTGVLADILIVRRRDGEGPIDESWMGTSGVPGVPSQECNDYFINHPEHVLGEWAEGRAPRYGHTLAVKAPEDQDLTSALGEAFDSITTAARAAGREWKVAAAAQQWTVDNLPFPVREDGRKEGSFHLVDGKPHEVIDGELVRVERAGKELPKLIRLRDATLKLIEAETNHDTPDEQLNPLRAEVNRLYDAYARVHGPINRYTLAQGEVDEETGERAVSRRYPRLGGFRRDPDFVAVLALEDFDDETQTAAKAPLLTRRVNKRIERPTSAASPEEALSLCLNFKNKVDVPVIAQLLSIDEDQVAAALGELVFPDPDTGELLTSGEYLSGPVVDKLERAEFLLSQGREELQRHVDALREVQPEPLPPEDIKAKLGAPWIPVEDVAAFAEELLGTQVDIVHVAKTATWNVDQPMTVPEAATSEWGTSRVNAFELLDLALNGQAPKVYDTFRTPDGGSKRVRNDKETLLAETKQADLARRFASWVWEDADRAERLAADYNRTFNSTVLRRNDGSHLTVDGLDPEFTPYEHQWDFVQRVLTAEEGSLCPYPVGAGKTATMFMTALKLKQLGLVNKPMIVVPNHLLEQISRDGKKLFQNARILMAGKKDLADARSRMLFAARCATGDWDAIVMTHNSFGRLGVHPVTEATYLEELANAYREALSAVDGDDANQRRIKEIAKMVDRFDARATDLRSKATDAGVTYENLGIDFLQIDEAHLFKNLALPATTEGMALGKPSKRATDLDLKILITRERTGRDNVVALYSGTFISNSVREMFVFKHYTMPKRLEKLGLGSPDAWAANFIHFESRPEVGVDGVSFRLKRRPVEYTNADEALAMFQEVAELRPREDFKIKRPQRVDRFVEIEATPQLVNYVGTISDRIDRIQGGKVKPWEDNMLNVITDGRKAALDLELVGLEPDGPGKAGAIAENVLNVYHRTKDLKLPDDPEDVAGGFQIVFCDLGTPSKEKGSQVYGKIRRQLIDGGIPRERIRFIHDYNSDLAKEQLFTDCRAGKVSVLFASTEKAGVGTNVQTRGVALHHADPPHKPAEWEQREGRLDRPGNGLIDLGMEVEFYRYLAKNSFDSFMFQQLERKQRPIVQIMSGRKVGRVIQEIDPVGAGFGQAKAIVAGNPLLLELADVNGELQVLLNAADGHRQAQSRMRRKVEVLADQISQAERSLAPIQAMADAVAGAADDMWRTADGRLVDADDVPAALAQAAQGAKPRLDLSDGFTWRGIEVGFTFHRRQQFGGVAYESYAHLVAGDHEVDVRLNLSWFGKGQTWRITKALGEAADEAMTAPDELRRQITKWQAQLEDAQSHIGRPFGKHAELEAVRERRAALEAAIAAGAADSGREASAGPQFEPGAAGTEMTEADMAMHDAAVMAGTMGGTAVVFSEGQIVGAARRVDTPAPAEEPPLSHLPDPRRWDEALRAITEAGAADSDVTAWAQVDGNEGARFRGAFADWAQEWVLEYANRPEDRPQWVNAYLDDQAYAARDELHKQAAEAVWRQARAVTAEPGAAPAQQTVTEAPTQVEPAAAAEVDAALAPPTPAPEPEAPASGPRSLTDPQLWEEGLRTLVDGAAGVERLEQAARVNDDANFRIVFADWAEDWMMDRFTGPTAGWPQWARLYFGGGDEAYENREQLHTEAAAAVIEQLRAADDATPAVPSPAAAVSRTADTRTPAPESSPLREPIDGLGDRAVVGHIGPQPARTHQSAGWAITAVLNDNQVRGLVSAVAVDGQPPSPEPGVIPTDRVREWIADQQQAPTAAFYASISDELPPPVRGDGDVRLSTNAEGLTVEQGDVSTTILWEELPAWIDAAVAHDTASRSPYDDQWRYGSLHAEIHFRRDERNQAIRNAMDALATALRETAPPSDEQLAASRDRYGPRPAADTEPKVPAADTAPEAEETRLPEDAKPVPNAEGYHYTEVGRTVRLYTEPGEEVGTAKWSYTKYRYEGDVRGDTVRGTEEAATVAKRMANHHAAVYGAGVHRPPLDDQGRDPVWILHNGSDTLVFGVRPEDDTARAAMWTGGGFKESRKVGGWYLPRTWKEPTRKQRVDTAVRVLAAAGRTVTVHVDREERQRTERPARLPELAVAAPNLDEVPQLFRADPFADEADMAQDVERLESTYERWSQHPTVVAYNNQDSDARPDGFGTPDNPIAELRVAYVRAMTALRHSVSGGPDEILRRIYGVAAWCQALEPVVEANLLAPLQDLYAAAHGLATRSQATNAAFAALASAAPAEEASAPREEAEALAADEQDGTPDQQPSDSATGPKPVGATADTDGEPDEQLDLFGTEADTASSNPSDDDTEPAPPAEQEQPGPEQPATDTSAPENPQDAEETTEAAPETAPVPSGPEQTESAVPAARASDADLTPKPAPEAVGATADTVGEPDEQLDLLGTPADASPDGPSEEGGEAAPGEGIVEAEASAPAGDKRAPKGESEDAVAVPEAAAEADTTTTVQPPDEPGTILESVAAATGAEETPLIEDPSPPDWNAEDLAIPMASADDAPPQPNAPTTQPQTAAPERTEEPPMATPATEPAEAPPAPARYETPAQVQDWDRRYHLHLSGLAGQEPDSGEVRYGTPVGDSVPVATLHRSATNRWFARLATGDESVPGDVTPLAPTPREAARQGAQMWSYAMGQPYGDEPAAFQRQGPVSRSDALRTELGGFLDGTQQIVQNAAARAWPSTYGQLPELQHLGDLFDALQPWQRPESPAGTANGALQIVEQLEALQQAADAWRASLVPGSDERQHMAFPLARLASESVHLQQQIAATVEEVGAERARVRAEEEAQQLAAPAVASEPPREERAADPATDGERLQAAAETAVTRAQQENQPGARLEPPTEAQGDSLPARALARAAAAPSRDQQDLPLWTGNDRPTGAWREEDGVLYDAYGAPQWRLKTAPDDQPSTQTPAENRTATPEADAYDPVDLKHAFTSTVAEAWADIVPPEHGTVEDLLEAVDAPLRELEEQWQRAVPVPRADGEQQAAPARANSDAPASLRRDAEPVNAALQQADAHAAALQDLPEWQRLQTVRGAATHLWNVLRERAGEYFEQLRSDVRVQGFWRTVSIRTTSKIAEWAQAAAGRVRRGGDLPTGEALLKLSDAALTYSTPGIPRPDRPAPDTAARDNVPAEVRQLRTTMRTGAPVPYGTREDAVQASRKVAEAFQAWRETPMGQELTTASKHPRVLEFRQAWQRLPGTDLPEGPGTAAGPYGDVGRNAQALVERAEAANAERAQKGQPPRFADADVSALRTVATLAEHHGGRLAVTLPPGLAGRAVPGTATPAAVVSRPTVAAPVVPTSTAAGPSRSA